MEEPTGSIKEAESEWKVVRSRKGKPQAKRHLQKSGEEGHLSCCPGHGTLSSWDADEEQRLGVRLQKSMERVRTSAFFKQLIEQMQDLQILEKLLANGRAGSLNRNQTVVKDDFAGLPNVGPNSVDHEASTFHFSDGTRVPLTELPFLDSCIEV